MKGTRKSGLVAEGHHYSNWFCRDSDSPMCVEAFLDGESETLKLKLQTLHSAREVWGSRAARVYPLTAIVVSCHRCGEWRVR